MLGLSYSNVSAQDGPYLTVYGAYALPMASVNGFANSVVLASDSMVAGSGGQSGFVSFVNSSEVTTVDGDGNTITNGSSSKIGINLGKGLNFGVSFGYMFNDHIGAELGVGYFLGSKTEFLQETRDESDPDNITTTTLNGELSANQIRINPSIVLSTDFKDFMPYAKFGIVLGIGTKITESYSDKKTNGADNIEQVFESKGGLGIGVSAALGAVYQFNKKTGLFLELASTSMSYSPKTRTLTDYTINGDDMIATGHFSLSSTETEYVDEVGLTDNAERTNSTLALKGKYPFSSFTINLGLRFNF